jgi:hypothetical protein
VLPYVLRVCARDVLWNDEMRPAGHSRVQG